MNVIEHYKRKKKESEHLYWVIVKWAAREAGIYLTRSWTWQMDLNALKIHFKYEYDRGGSYRTDKKTVDLRPLVDGKPSKVITVNGTSHRIYDPYLTFEQIVEMSGEEFKNPDLASVTYKGSWARGQNRMEGKLLAGQDCELIEGMSFRVALVEG